MNKQRLTTALLLPTLLLAPLGCETMSEHRVASGAGIGAAAGALAGGIIGHQTGHKWEGAAIGAATGALVGGGIGYYLDRRARKFQQVEDVQVYKAAPQPAADVPAGEEPQKEHLVLVINNTMLFEQGSSALAGNGSNSQLDKIAKILQEQPRERIIVRGYTSSEGSDASNQSLSERRANAVRNYLLGQGINPDRITAVGMGESNPIASNDTEAGRAQNRRVEIEVFPDDRDVQSE